MYYFCSERNKTYLNILNSDNVYFQDLKYVFYQQFKFLTVPNQDFGILKFYKITIFSYIKNKQKLIQNKLKYTVSNNHYIKPYKIGINET